MDVIQYKDKFYPKFQAEGCASQFALPYAKHVCKGTGYDIGCMKKEWAFPGALPIDVDFDDEHDATNLPKGKVDYIFSSHCLEHLDNWVLALDYWSTKLKNEGVIFLYLPHYSQEYWRPWNNRKHVHILDPIHLTDYFLHNNFTVFSSGPDLNNSFMVIASKNRKNTTQILEKNNAL